ncbi:hypothetical protein [Simiduia curdlanivorans]|uniref:Uncharacterized protein n=1 Tax=Simiduia curdlanivorans TaxID=1492769 RepID=A0ABV8V5G0_9GAMM
MIKYRFEEESKYLDYHLEKMGDVRAKEIVASENIISEEDAEYLATFFWKMVDFSIKEEKYNVDLPWPESREFWNEKLMYSISSFIESQGFDEVWDKVVDQQ